MIELATLHDAWKRYWRFTPRRTEPELAQWVLTALMGLLCGIVLSLFGKLVLFPDSAWARWWLGSLLPTVFLNLSIFFCCRLAFRLAERWVPPSFATRLTGRPSVRSSVFFAALAISGAASGWILASSIIGLIVQRDIVSSPTGLPLLMLGGTVLSLVWSVWAVYQWRRQQLKTRLTEARLKSLQAQIEPHFLFNTLANIRSLIDHEPRQAGEMLDLLARHLRHSLGSMRAEVVPLAQELDMVQDYLRLMQIRMSERLTFNVDTDEEARQVAIPPLVLQPLVENAIHHGLEPRVEGGHVHILARVSGQYLHIYIRDNGIGIRSDEPLARRGHGLALENIRERLASRYGSAARLTLQPAAVQGTEAAMEIPVKDPT